ASVGVEGSTRAGFTEKTGIVMRMKAEKFTLGGSATVAEETKYSTTYAEAAKEPNEYSDVSFTNSDNKINQRYWDDAYGRNTKLSIFAVAVPGKTSGISQLNLNGEESWHSEQTETNTIKWTVSTSQDGTKIGEEDLVYSNNIQEGGEYGVREWDFNSSQYKDFNGDISDLSNGRMKFQLKPLVSTAPDPTGPGKFDTGNLNFTHALCRVTININYGNEYNDTETASKAILKQMPYESVLNLTDGKFAAIDAGVTKKNDITMHNTTPTEGYKATFMGQVVPGYKINKATENTNFLQFNIGENTYYISQKMVYEALNVSGNETALVYDDENRENIIMSQGQHYILNIRVTKTEIKNITATLVDWTPISGNAEKNNSYLVFDKTNDFSPSGPTTSENFDIYRLNKRSENITTDKSYQNYEWKSGWSDESDWRITPSQNGGKWTTTWYFEDNKSFYHFRMVGTDGSGHRSISKDANNGDYFTIQGGNSDGNYRWGAPMANGADFGYSLNTGFDNKGASGTKPEHNIHYAIGSTESEIPFTEFHMLSQIHVILETTSTADAVKFDGGGTNKAVVKIKSAMNSGKVRMGDGLVTATGVATDISMKEPSDYWETEDTKTQAYTYYAVPQALTGLVFEITTPDNNIYKIDVDKINPTPNTHEGYWIPNYKYVYTLKLTKTGITNITCTLKNWEEISGSGNITIED
ncbi:MAG: fimbrillin family protein, partial [Roseburia sp.]